MKTRIPRTYKTLMAIVVVAGPLIWLLLTPDGQRRTDLTLLPLFGRPLVAFSFTDLNSKLQEKDIRALIPNVGLQCTDGPTPFGGRLCNARIGAFGRLPSESLSFFFDAGDLMAAKLVYRRDVHAELVASLTRQLGQGETSKRSDTSGAPRVMTWQVPDGMLLAPAGDLGPSDEAALLWLSGSAVTKRIDAVRLDPQGG
jgi:hypothetical protein